MIKSRQGIRWGAGCLAIAMIGGCSTAPRSGDTSNKNLEPPVVVSEKMPARAEPTPPPVAIKQESAPATDLVPLQNEKKLEVSEMAPPPAPKVESMPPLPSDDHTFLVTVANRTAAHPMAGKAGGHPKAFVLNGVQGRPVVVVRGQTYTFDVKTDVKHDFYLSTSDRGWGAAVYIRGVSGHFTYEGPVTFSPDAETPPLLYYQCRNHQFMGGEIHVVASEDEARSLNARLDDMVKKRTDHSSAMATDVGAAQVKQKISYADMLVKIKGKTVDAGVMAKAQSRLDQARKQLESGNHADALALATEAAGLLTAPTTSTAGPSETELAESKKEYQEKLEAIHSFQASHQETFDREKKKGGKAVDYDHAKLTSLMDEAAAQAAKNQYNAAIRTLSRAEHEVTFAVNAMLHSQTVVYEKSFKTAKDEYAYELQRFGGYEELIPVAIEQKKPSDGVMKLMQTYVDKGTGLRDQAIERAGGGDYANAILMLQAGTDNVRRGLRLLGVTM